MNNFVNLLLLELNLVLGRISNFFSSVLFITVSLILMQFALGSDNIINFQIFGAFMSIITVFLSLSNVKNLYEEELKSGFLRQLLIYNISPAELFICKSFLHLLSVALPIALSMIISWHIFSLEYKLIIKLLFSLLLVLPMISLLINFSYILTLKNAAVNNIVYLVVGPFIIPSLIFAQAMAFNNRTTPEWSVAFNSIWGLYFIMLPLTIFAGSYLLRHNIEQD